MTDEELSRYGRHILLNEWGVEAQERLASAKVLVVGMGGIGCPAARMLAAAGVGTLTIADGDVVEASNLQRQYLHTTDTLGMPKVLSAQKALTAINPHCTVVPLHTRLAGQALLDAVAAHDAVLDCCDNFATRHAINRACVAAAKTLVSGAAIRFDGQLIVFNAAHTGGACYHCLFPEHVDGEENNDEDRCAITGVYAPLTQQIGGLQAAEALKLITGVGTVPVGMLRLYNALHSSYQSIAVPKDPACVVCG